MTTKVSLLGINKHGQKEINRLRKLVEDDMCCPQCGYSLEEAQSEYKDKRHATFIKAYAPIIFKENVLHDLEYSCRRCECEWTIQIEESKITKMFNDTSWR